MATAPVRYPSGVNNVAPMPSATGSDTDTSPRQHPLYGFPALDPFRLIVDSTDFMEFTAADWTATAVGSGTAALVAGNGGLLQLITSGTTADSVALQRPVANFAVPAGPNRLWFECDITPQDATGPQILIGLTNATTTPGTIADGIWFNKAAGVATVNLISSKASTATTQATAITTLVNATATKLAFHINPSGELMYYINNVLTGRISSPANIPLSSTNLTIQMFIKTASGATKYVNVDYVMAAAETSR